jgi:signal transduction histidine kinase
MDEGAGESAAALGRQLEGVVAELEAVSHGSRARLPEVVDLDVVISELLPALRVLMGEDARMLAQLAVDPLLISAHRAGLERMVFHLLAHAHAARSGGNSIVIETSRVGDAAELLLYGDGLGIDDGLMQLSHSPLRGEWGERGETVSADSLGMGLWVAHCEALLHGASITVTAEHGGEARIRVLFPLVATATRG